jgi:hypothetical protein
MKKLNGNWLLLMSIIVAAPIISMSQNENSGKLTRSYMHNEKPDDKYVASSPSRHLKTSAYTYESSIFFTTQVNVDENGNNILFDAANEPSIAIDPTNPNRMVIGWRQFDDVNNNFRQAGYGYTIDGGQTWTFPGVIDPGIFRSDPVLDCNAAGIFYYNSLTVDGGGNYSCNVYRNDPGTFNWDDGPFAQGGDKQWMVIDRSGGMGDGNVYSFWNASYSICDPGSFTRSTNGGDSYEDCVIVDTDPYWGTMAVGKDGELYVTGQNWDGIMVAKSTNAQNAASIVSWDSYSQVDLDGYLSGWNDVNPVGLMGQVNVSVDISDGPGSGNVYVLASVQRNSGDPGDVMFARSTDGGNTWSPPMRINDDLGWNDYQWFGTLSVAPNGRIDAAWLDTRDDPSGNILSALYYSYSMDQGFTWSANEKLSENFDPHVGWPNQQKMGDYFEMESDESSAHLAWCNTLNGEQDVYYARITPQLTGANEPLVMKNLLSLTNYPNPFMDQTTIRYILPVSGDVKLVLFDICGREIRTLVDEQQSAGTHNLTISSENIPQGVCYCRIVTGKQTQTINLTRIK